MSSSTAVAQDHPSYKLLPGRVPLIISMPHNGTEIPEDIQQQMTPEGLAVADTDWYIDQLYDFAPELGACCLMPTYNRYVIDLNRDPEGVNLYPGQQSTELCPTTSFAQKPLYLPGKAPDNAEIQRRITLYWQPYHQALQQQIAALKAEFGYVILFEAHSILSRVPRFFSGQLPDFNFGTANNSSCGQWLSDALEHLDLGTYSKVHNGRFKGGYITRAYGDPEQQVHAIQLELSQATYLQEQQSPANQIDTAAFAQVQPMLERIITTLLTRSAQLKS